MKLLNAVLVLLGVRVYLPDSYADGVRGDSVPAVFDDEEGEAVKGNGGSVERFLTSNLNKRCPFPGEDHECEEGTSLFKPDKWLRSIASFALASITPNSIGKETLSTMCVQNMSAVKKIRKFLA